MAAGTHSRPGTPTLPLTLALLRSPCSRTSPVLRQPPSSPVSSRGDAACHPATAAAAATGACRRSCSIRALMQAPKREQRHPELELMPRSSRAQH